MNIHPRYALRVMVSQYMAKRHPNSLVIDVEAAVHDFIARNEDDLEDIVEKLWQDVWVIRWRKSQKTIEIGLPDTLDDC